MIIDFHTHIFHEDIGKNREDYMDDLHFNHLYNNAKSKIISHNALLEYLNISQIDYAVAMGFSWINEKYCEKQNEYFKAVKDITDSRILPFGSVPLHEKNIDAWVKDIKNKGLYGIGEVGFYAEGLDKKNEEYLRKILISAQTYSLPVCLHVNEPVGHTYSGKYETDFFKLYSIINDYPDVIFILSHWGGGLLFYELMPEVSQTFKRIYYDTAASPFLYDNKIYNIAAEIIGSEKILFGSDYPLINVKRYIDPLEASVLDKNIKENILGKNAYTLLELQKKDTIK